MTSQHPQRVPVGVDPNTPSIARAYDFALGGTDNYEVDRQLLAQLEQLLPETKDLAIVNRAFLVRACRFLATQTDLEQYIDCGSGLPTSENVHQIVQRFAPETRVVYVDNDPVVLAHGRALLEENEFTRFLAADIYEPRTIIDNDVVRELIDFSAPMGFFQFGTLHHFAGPREQPRKIIKEYIDALPSGSYVAISHFLDPENEDTELVRNFEQILNERLGGAGNFRTMSEIEELFDGLELVEPGITRCVDWWPDGPQLAEPNRGERWIAGGVGRKP